MILLLRDLEGKRRGDEAVQESAREVVRLGTEAGDKVEFMMFVSWLVSSADSRLTTGSKA